MSVTVKHLNGDASFLLTFQPLLPFPATPGLSSKFSIVIDPWLSGPSNIIHPFFSSSKMKTESCITSLADIPPPDLIIISQAMSDHCHKGTLMKLPKTGGKFLILAEPSAAKLIRSWKHFDESKVITLKAWSPPTKGVQSPNIHQITLPSPTSEGRDGEATITLIREGDTAGVKNAIAITYRAPASHLSTSASGYPTYSNNFTPPASPSSTRTLHQPASQRTLSVIHAPHGIPYSSLHPFVTSHMISTCALPLTVFLHCFDRVQNPRWLGGNICAGAESGVEIAQQLMAKAWISNHDGDKLLKGVANRMVKIEKWGTDKISERVSPHRDRFQPGDREETEVLVMGIGEERVFSSVGIFCGSRDGNTSASKAQDLRKQKSWAYGFRGSEETAVGIEVENIIDGTHGIGYAL